MTYPTLERYQEALQAPSLALTDPELKRGRIATSGLGTPLARCGGFALTYQVTCGSGKFALRCFHKEAKDLETRYEAIAVHLKTLRSNYFLPFDFQRQGIRIDGALFPVVKMAWAEGDTLGDFLEREHSRASALSALRTALGGLAAFLESSGVAHGDIQPGNLMVGDGGRTVRLIDYDGMFVPSLSGRRSNEIGQINFQHSGRTEGDFNAQLDRFSFIVLDVALQALIAVPGLWAASKSDQDGVVFRAADFRSPASSPILARLSKISSLSQAIERFASVAAATFSSTPTLTDFAAGRSMPSVVVALGKHQSGDPVGYQGAYSVLDANSFESCKSRIGDRVELVGKVVGVFRGTSKTRQRAPYIFVNFSRWRGGDGVRLVLWSDGIALQDNVPAEMWEGTWLSVTGLLEKYSGPHGVFISLTVNQKNQIHKISPEEAKRRLVPYVPSGPAPSPTRNNAGVVSGMAKQLPDDRGPLSKRPAAPPLPSRPTSISPPVSSPVLSTNRAVAERMRAATSQVPSRPSPLPPSQPPVRSMPAPPQSTSPHGTVGQQSTLVEGAIRWFKKLIS